MKKLTWSQSYFKHSCARWWFRLTTSAHCAWCGRITRRAPLQFLRPAQFTHGICRDCCSGLVGDLPQS